MTSRPIDPSLEEIRHQLLQMAGFVEKAISESIEILVERDAQKIADVMEIEDRVNRSQMEIDAYCLKTLATQSPLAGDLRFILSAIKINNDLERMVDQAVNIAHNAEFYLNQPPEGDISEISKMAEEVKAMVRQTIDAFVMGEESIARNVLQRDDTVDQYKNRIFHGVLESMRQDPKRIEKGVNLILIARNLERIGDHATNIAEDIIFTKTGIDIRHHSENG